MIRTRDLARPAPGLVKARKLEEEYARQLRKVARQVGMIVEGWFEGHDGEFDASAVPGLQLQLQRYSEVLEPWAKSTAQRIGAEIAIKERRGWAEHARLMSRARRDELLNTPTGHVLREMLAVQVGEIKSIPLNAAERVYGLTLKGLETSGRASEIAKEIMRSGDVAASDATRIARTAVSTTATKLVEARATSIGSEGYIFRTSRDTDVRPSHRPMEGVFVLWSKPPTLDGYTAHAGCFANCRCYPEPVIPGID